jgi:hypothetical protein
MTMSKEIDKICPEEGPIDLQNHNNNPTAIDSMNNDNE